MFRSIIAACVAALVSTNAASQDWGDWEIVTTDGANVIQASADAQDGSNVRLALRCDANAGMELWLMRPAPFFMPPSSDAYVTTDESAPRKATAVSDDPESPVVRIPNAESLERALFTARVVAVRVTNMDGVTRTYRFRFENLSGGKSLVLKSCPA